MNGNTCRGCGAPGATIPHPTDVFHVLCPACHFNRTQQETQMQELLRQVAVLMYAMGCNYPAIRNRQDREFCMNMLLTAIEEPEPVLSRTIALTKERIDEDERWDTTNEKFFPFRSNK